MIIRMMVVQGIQSKILQGKRFSFSQKLLAIFVIFFILLVYDTNKYF